MDITIMRKIKQLIKNILIHLPQRKKITCATLKFMKVISMDYPKYMKVKKYKKEF